MSTVTSEIVAAASCRGARLALLVEQRLYPSDWLDDVSAPFLVRARQCTEQLACREAGMPCRWTGLNPTYDPFQG